MGHCQSTQWVPRCRSVGEGEGGKKEGRRKERKKGRDGRKERRGGWKEGGEGRKEGRFYIFNMEDAFSLEGSILGRKCLLFALISILSGCTSSSV